MNFTRPQGPVFFPCFLWYHRAGEGPLSVAGATFHTELAGEWSTRMIQNIRPHIFHNEYRPAPPREEDLVFAFSEEDRKILLSRDEKRVPRVSDLAQADRECLRFLFSLDEKNCFLFWKSGAVLEIPGFFYDGIKTLRRDGSDVLGFAGSTAWHLATWYRKNVCCGACGTKMVPGTRERCMVCPSCGNVVYPVIAPAVIIGITDGDRIVMTRYRGREYKGRALVAGFCEIGEEAEDTVRREAKEETGLSVTNIRYAGSQPWGFDANLLLGFFCDVTGDKTIVREEDELAACEWVRREDITEDPNLLSLTATMIERFREHGECGAVSEV